MESVTMRQNDFDNPNDNQTRFYRKKGASPMAPWTPTMDMTGVSVSDADKATGSPRAGDMIAHNPSNQADRWLVAEAYFNQHYELAT
jgi:hypothetical protein